VRSASQRTLVAIAALFLLPLVVAFVTYYGTRWRPAGHVNHGVLISPPRPLPRLTLAPAGATGVPSGVVPFGGGQWSLVYLGDGGCDADCRAALYVMRQTRLALNDDMTRVRRVFLATADCCARELLAREHPGLTVLDAAGLDAAPLVREFPAAGREHQLFVVDPLGNLVMSYDARHNPRALLEDLKKLLRLSQIG
jgi:hypothetical protein